MAGVRKGLSMRYSGLKVITEGLLGHKGWTPAWRDPSPKAEYDAIIIGGGGHGLSTAFYLAKNHGLTNIAVLEKSHIGSGNIGRNTTIVRANYILPGNSEFYSHSWTVTGCGSICPTLISNRRASRSMAVFCTHAAAAPGTTRWPGAMRAAPTSAAWT